MQRMWSIAPAIVVGERGQCVASEAEIGRQSTSKEHGSATKAIAANLVVQVATHQTVRPDPFCASAHLVGAHQAAECGERVVHGFVALGVLGVIGLNLLERGQAELVRAAVCTCCLNVLNTKLWLAGEPAERLKVLHLQGLDLKGSIWTGHSRLHGRAAVSDGWRARCGGAAAWRIDRTDAIKALAVRHGVLVAVQAMC